MMLDLTQFFASHSIPYQVWGFEIRGKIIYTDTLYVIGSILSLKGDERSKVAGTLFALDFEQRPIEPYLKELGRKFLENK